MNGTRRSGRTTRMLHRAIHAARTGSPLIVVAADQAHVVTMRNQLLAELDHLGYDRALAKHIPVMAAAGYARLSAARGEEIPGFRGVVYIDHYAIEREIAQLTRQLADLREKLTEEPYRREEAPHS